MKSILKRVGYVLFSAVAGGVVGTIGVFLFTFVKTLIGNGGFVSPVSAMTLGFGWFGAICALMGAHMGKEAAAERDQPPNRTPDIAAWVAAVVIALVCVSIAFGH